MNPVGRGRHVLAEIANQPEAWSATIAQVEGRAGALRALTAASDEVVFTGCGSGLNASVAIAPVFQALTGIRARAVPAAEIVFFPETVFGRRGDYLVVAFSRSGSTTEVVRAAEVAHDRGMKTLAITCDPTSPLARGASEALVLEAAGERAITTTQSLTSMILAGQVLSGLVAQQADYLAQLHHLPGLGRQVIDRYHGSARRLGEDPSIVKFAVVGSGPYRGLAREAQLKLKEMTLLPADSYPLFDYRHGPKSNVDAGMLVIAFLSDRAREAEVGFLQEMRGLGGRVLAICDRADAAVERHADDVLAVGSGLPDMARGILYLPPIQFLACYKALALGQDPDRPRNLDYWVETHKLWCENRGKC